MHRTNIYLTEIQKAEFGRFSKATGISVAALVRSACDHMIANPEQFPALHPLVGGKRGTKAVRRSTQPSAEGARKSRSGRAAA